MHRALFLLLKISASLSLGISVGVQAQATDSSCPPPPMPLDQQMAYISGTPAKNSGFLWRIEKDGRTSWLYGTMHLNHIDYAKPGQQVMMGMRISDVLALEINPYEPQTLNASVNPAEFKFSSAQLGRLSKAYAKDCLLLNANNGSASLSTAPLLSTQAQRQALFWGYSPDARLAQIAQRMNKPILALETSAQHVKALAPSSQAEFDQAFEVTLTAFESGKMQAELAQLNKAWQ